MSICGKCGGEYESGSKCKPCRNRRLQDQRQTRKCVACGVDFVGTKGSKATRCPDCYPKYRRAYNLLHSCKHRAKQAGIEFNLTQEWIQSGVERGCPMTGECFILGEGSDYSDRNPMTPSIDKIDPTGGYTMDNCRVVSWFYNLAKARWTDEEVISLCTKIAKAHS